MLSTWDERGMVRAPTACRCPPNALGQAAGRATALPSSVAFGHAGWAWDYPPTCPHPPPPRRERVCTASARHLTTLPLSLPHRLRSCALPCCKHACARAPSARHLRAAHTLHYTFSRCTSRTPPDAGPRNASRMHGACLRLSSGEGLGRRNLPPPTYPTTPPLPPLLY